MAQDEEAMVAFCRAQYPRLVGVLAFSVGDRGVAEELAQETLIRVCQHWSRVAGMSSPQAWTHRVAQNLATSWVRRRAAERRASQRLQGQRALEAVEAASDDVLAVRHAIRELPRRQRTALVLRYYADLPAAEVAAAMGCAEGTVRALTYQAVNGLRATSGLVELREAFDVA